MEFTYKSYREMLAMLKYNGYKFVNYHTSDNIEKSVILRHDIDTSIQKAIELARIEASEGVNSTYFVLLGTPFYNIAEKSNREMLLEIRKLGHDIGLHFDEMNYLQGVDIEATIMHEALIMEQILGFKIKSVSMHRPSRLTLEANYQLNGILVNSYSEKFFKTYKYVSDSRRRWRENIEEIINSNDYPKLHILTHAFWYNNEEQSLAESLKKYIGDAKKERYYALFSNITDLESIVKETEI